MGALTEQVCALCMHFHTRYTPKHAAVGLGVCKLPIKDVRIEKFYPAGAAACKSFGAGTNLAARQSFLKKHREAA
jgi:hypothetical protein